MSGEQCKDGMPAGKQLVVCCISFVILHRIHVAVFLRIGISRGTCSPVQDSVQVGVPYSFIKVSLHCTIYKPQQVSPSTGVTLTAALTSQAQSCFVVPAESSSSRSFCC